MAYDIDAMRKKLNQMTGKQMDADEFRPKKNESTTEPIKYRFYVLPPLLEGDALKSGVVKKAMDLFYIKHGSHWINNRPHPCPRAAGSADKCPVCQFGFDQMRDEKDEDKRRKIRSDWMPSENYLVNVYFTNWKGNPEELRGKIKFFNATSTCFKLWSQALEREDSGDPDEPEAFGAFFDENNGSLFELSVLKQGKNNSYATSAFRKEKSGPMVVDADGKPNTKGLAALLKLRVNLWEKVQMPDAGALKSLLNSVINGDEYTPPSDSKADSSFDVDELEGKAPAKPTPAKGAGEKISKPSSATSDTEIDNLLGQLNDD
jgi:hypothetical protein